MSDNQKKKIIDKVKKLLALSENNKNDNESLEALAQAQRLMAKHGMQQCDLEETLRDEENVIQVRCKHKWDAGYRKPLAAVISENYRCKSFISGGTVVFLGVEEDAIIAKQAFEFAYKFIMRRGNQEYEKFKKSGYSGRGVFNSYATGFIYGLKEVLEAQSKALMMVVPETVNRQFNNLDLNKGRGGITQPDGLYRDIVETGKKDATDQYSQRALNS